MDARLMNYVFGDDSRGDTPEERARSSRLEFVRSQDHLSLFTPTAKGHRLTAYEAWAAYGFETLREVMDYGAAILADSRSEPAATIKQRREALGLSVKDVARATLIPEEQVRDCENEETRSPIKHIERIATSLGLDERMVSITPGAGGDSGLAVRLKTLLKEEQLGLSPSVVLTLSEAAWVIKTQIRLQHLLKIERRLPEKFEQDYNYGSPGYPSWRHGYYLATRARDIIGFSHDQPIDSLRSMCEGFGIPLLYTTWPEQIAGATVISNGVRGILVNTSGYNTNVWVRRATIAHELGHLFWDPERELNSVKVDSYDEIESLSRDKPDYVEARANAFAIAFLAPETAVRREFNKYGDLSTGLRAVMEKFGISYTAAKNHIINLMDSGVEQYALTVDDSEPTHEWRGREAYTDDYFPLRNTSQLRRGGFAGLVVAAHREGLISLDTACEYLQTTPGAYEKSSDGIAGAFPADGS